MRTAKEARQWVYRDLVARSLRKHESNAALLPKGLTDAQRKRVQREMLRLADWLEAKAARLASAPEPISTTEEESKPCTDTDEAQ